MWPKGAFLGVAKPGLLLTVSKTCGSVSASAAAPTELLSEGGPSSHGGASRRGDLGRQRCCCTEQVSQGRISLGQEIAV